MRRQVNNARWGKKDTAARHDGSLVVHAGLLLPPAAAPEFDHNNTVINLQKLGGNAWNILVSVSRAYL